MNTLCHKQLHFESLFSKHRQGGIHPSGRQSTFVVTNPSRNPRFVCDDIYVLRGNAENRIKELKLDLKADRLNCHRFLANQFRLLLHTAAYCLFWLLRHHLQGTELATAQVNTLRLKLLKIGARIRETSRRIWVHLASGYPYRDPLAGLLQNLRASPASYLALSRFGLTPGDR